MNNTVIKIFEGRKRFIKTRPIKDFSNWMSHLSELKNFISNQTSLQIVGDSIYFEMGPLDAAPRMMLQVLGIPSPLEGLDFVLSDLEECEVLIHKITDFDLFSLDLDQLLETTYRLKERLEAEILPNQSLLSPFFHFVFNLDKIELHFFRQKDYIQKQF